jgi:hypothetical protein
MTVTQCAYRQQKWSSQQKAVVVEYEVEEPRRGWGHWIAQVQSRSTGGEGGVLFPWTCFQSNSSDV